MLGKIWRLTPRSVGKLLALAAVLGLVIGLAAAPAQAIGLCRICHATDPCTGTFYSASGCCPMGSTPVCLTCISPGGCICGISVVCLNPPE
jgi:hypothetical protein